MYVFKKKQRIILFALIETEKKRREKKIGILDDGMVMYVECDEDDDERSPSFFSLSLFSNRFSLLSPSLVICALASATSMHIIISCFVRRKKEKNR